MMNGNSAHTIENGNSAHTNENGNSAHTFQLALLYLQTRCHLVSHVSVQITTAGDIIFVVVVAIITLLRIYLQGNLRLT
jgi:hypothetical protein